MRMAKKSLKLKKNSVEFTVDLKELFGIDFKGNRALRELVGQKIIDEMRKRTDEGKAVGGKRDLKAPYSKMYADSDEFKAFGKSKNKVNMQLTGDMMGLMDIKKQDGNTITIGWDESEENHKAYNHNTGDTVPKRPFFGMTNEELNQVKRELKPEIKEALGIKQGEGRKAFESFILSQLDKLTGGNDGGQS